jgi:hypothetical protein
MISHNTVLLENSYLISKRLGLAQIPLVCVATKYISIALSYPELQNYLMIHDFGSNIILGIYLIIIFNNYI